MAVLCCEGRELDVITQAEAIDSFRAVREDLDRLGRAATLLEAVDLVVQERDENARLYQMLLGALRTLAAHDAPLMVPAFFWKLLAAEGFSPVLDVCAACGADGRAGGLRPGRGRGAVPPTAGGACG